MINTKIAAIQMVSGRELQDNLNVAERLIKQAADGGSQLIVLPEVFAMFASSQQLMAGQEEAFGTAPIRTFLAEQAKKNGVWLVGGSIPIAKDDNTKKVFASSLLINDQGQECARYNKIHLFDADVSDKKGRYSESDTFLPGDEVVVVDTPFGRLGLAICYDLRFPEFFRVMFDLGVDIISLPSAFTKKTGEAHWLSLLRARAIENQCYIIAANQGGDHGHQRETSGESLIVNAWGDVLAQASKGESVVSAEIDYEQLKQLRQAMPIKQHQRFRVDSTLIVNPK
ncbi:MAG: nitrilase [Pseudohongiellaceae bacterium]|jgi:nitrilase